MSKTLNDLISLNEGGLSCMDYADIVQLLSQRYRLIYGYDIDLDPRSADGRFIYDVATIINSGIRVIKQIYNNLDPSTASGSALDMLCSLTNVYRREATKSEASIKISNKSMSDITINLVTNGILNDDSGNNWSVKNNTLTSVVIKGGETFQTIYECNLKGPYTTSSFKWAVYNNNNSSLTIEIGAIDLGSNEETDASLRSRRKDSSNNGITIKESLKGAVEEVDGVKKCYVKAYSGNSGDSNTVALNGVDYAMDAHTEVVLIAESSVNLPDDDKIFEAIDLYSTLGIGTYQSSIGADVSDAHKYKYQTISTAAGPYTYSQHWYICKPVTPKITITVLDISQNITESALKEIAQDLVSYMDSLDINQSYSQGLLMSSISKSTNNSYIVSNIDMSANANKGTYFEYGTLTSSDLTITSPTDGYTWTIVIERK